jgi:hypothetical protein
LPQQQPYAAPPVQQASLQPLASMPPAPHPPVAPMAQQPMPLQQYQQPVLPPQPPQYSQAAPGQQQAAPPPVVAAPQPPAAVVTEVSPPKMPAPAPKPVEQVAPAADQKTKPIDEVVLDNLNTKDSATSEEPEDTIYIDPEGTLHLRHQDKDRP